METPADGQPLWRTLFIGAGLAARDAGVLDSARPVIVVDPDFIASRQEGAQTYADVDGEKMASFSGLCFATPGMVRVAGQLQVQFSLRVLRLLARPDGGTARADR